MRDHPGRRKHLWVAPWHSSTHARRGAWRTTKLRRCVGCCLPSLRWENASNDKQMLPDVHQMTGEPVVTMNDMKITWEVGNHGGSFFFPSLSLVLHWARTLTNLFADDVCSSQLPLKKNAYLLIKEKLTLSDFGIYCNPKIKFSRDRSLSMQWDREPEISDRRERGTRKGPLTRFSLQHHFKTCGEPASQAPISCRNISSSLWIQEEHWMYRKDGGSSCYWHQNLPELRRNGPPRSKLPCPKAARNERLQNLRRNWSHCSQLLQKSERGYRWQQQNTTISQRWITQLRKESPMLQLWHAWSHFCRMHGTPRKHSMLCVWTRRTQGYWVPHKAVEKGSRGYEEHHHRRAASHLEGHETNVSVFIVFLSALQKWYCILRQVVPRAWGSCWLEY